MFWFLQEQYNQSLTILFKMEKKKVIKEKWQTSVWWHLASRGFDWDRKNIQMCKLKIKVCTVGLETDFDLGQELDILWTSKAKSDKKSKEERNLDNQVSSSMLSIAGIPISFSTHTKLPTNFFVDATGVPRNGCLQYLLCMSTWIKTLKAHTHTHHTHTKFSCSISQSMIKCLQLLSKVFQRHSKIPSPEKYSSSFWFFEVIIGRNHEQ